MARILYVGSAGLDKVVEHGVPIYVWGNGATAPSC